MKSLYIHIPFCAKKCFYCSFAVYVGEGIGAKTYLDCLEAEAKKYKNEPVETIYIGGGTPSRLTNKDLGRLVTLIYKYFKFKKNCEWTLEANPEDINNEKLAIIKNAGINRISLGVQTFQDKYLKYLGRNHSKEQVFLSYDKIIKAGFNNVNVDLMFGFPGQSLGELNKDIRDFVKLKSEHISIYSLSAEANSKFYSDKMLLPDSGLQAKFYTNVKKLLQKSGYKQYEVSNYSIPGKESKHNINYWSGGEYIGLGVAAHSHLNGVRFWNEANIFKYIKRIKDSKEAVVEREVLAPLDKMKENLLFGLRMNKGVDMFQLENKYQIKLKAIDKEKIALYIKEGLLKRRANNLSATDKGILVLDEISTNLI